MRTPNLAVAALVAAIAIAPIAHAGDKAKAEKDLKAAIQAGNSEGVQAACDELVQVGGKDAMMILIDFASKIEGVTYWQLTGAASGFQDGPALTELGKYVVAHQADGKSSLARDLMFGLQNNHSPKVTEALGVVLEKGKYDLQLMSVDQLALVKSVESIDVLVGAFKREEKGDFELRNRIVNTLRMLTGENFNSAADWENYWKQQRPNGVPDKKKPGEGGAVPGTMEKPRDNEFHQTVDKLPPGRVVVVTGCYDETQKILKEHKVPFTLAEKSDFDANPQKYLKDAYALLINCDDLYLGKVDVSQHPPGHPLTQNGLSAIKQWVETQGGYVFTEDWGLCEITAVLWPDKVSTVNGATTPPFLTEQTVKLTPVKGNTSHPLMRGVWQKPKKDEVVKPGEEGKTTEKDDSPAAMLNHKWKVDAVSAAIKIVDTQNVVPLLESEELGNAKNGTRVVAVTFRAGNWSPKRGGTATGPNKDKTGEFGGHGKGGRVLHTISHFGHQSSADDGAALHNLLINFLLEAAKHHEGVAEPAPKK